MRVLMNDEKSRPLVAECHTMYYDTVLRALVIRTDDERYLNPSVSEPTAADICRQALITGTADITPYDRTYTERQFGDHYSPEGLWK
ncbi:MAG: hypothetical protein J6I96_05950 [Oscillospiraceae bacterium]|nr:hypothetical protein [Oscillospiraceae bacterium]